MFFIDTVQQWELLVQEGLGAKRYQGDRPPQGNSQAMGQRASTTISESVILLRYPVCQI